MRAKEFITESTSPSITVRDAKRALSAMGFEPTGRGKGSHDVWKDSSGLLFTIPVHGKDLEYGVAKNLLKLIRSRQTELEEMAGEVHGGVRKALKDKGYKYLGSGIDKQAYLEPGTGQVLIVFGYRKGIQNFSPDQRMFIRWINYCNKNKNNPHLPKFSGFESFQFQGKNYIQARMEALRELSPEIGNLVSMLSLIVQRTGFKNFDKAIKEIVASSTDNDDDEITFNEDIQLESKQEVKNAIQLLGGIASAKNLLRTVYETMQFGRRHGFSIDLHRGNYMQRSDGTIVVNDPFVLWLHGYSE